MSEQTLLWQGQQKSSEFAELCTALYEREIALLANEQTLSVAAVQGRLKSLSYYIKRTAHLMIQANSPLTIDVQNATWSAKQASKIPTHDQSFELVQKWYLSAKLSHGLVVPIACHSHIVLDSIDRIDSDKPRFRTNVFGWFDLDAESLESKKISGCYLFKPNKRVMTAACTGHCWQNQQRVNPVIPSLRELLLSCAINWKNFSQPVNF